MEFANVYKIACCLNILSDLLTLLINIIINKHSQLFQKQLEFWS